MINGFGDLEGNTPGSALPVCQHTLTRARSFGDSVSFALAVFPMAPDKYSLDSWTYKDANGNNIAASSDSIFRWQKGLQACFKYAIDQGFRTLHILGHWDPLHPVLLRPTTWRNLMDISPRQKAAGYTYEDVLVRPVIQALNAVPSSATSIWFSISGEMGLSNYLYSKEWKKLLEDTRNQLRSKRWNSVKVATALNWQMFCGCVAPSNIMPGAFDPINYNNSFARKFGEVKQYALPLVPDFKALLAANDYLGVSAYGSNYPLSNLRWWHMELPMYTLAYELRFFGIDLKQYMKKPVIHVEQGLGGVLKYGMLPAPDLATVSRYPFSGNWPVDGYSKEVDPWQREDFAKYRRSFYKAALELLARKAGQFRVDGAFVWSVGSFDIFGVHPISTSSRGTFADKSIIEIVKRNNGVKR
eukprot:gene3580-3846_t